MSENNSKLVGVHVNEVAREYKAKEGDTVKLGEVFTSIRTMFKDWGSVALYVLTQKQRMLADGEQRYFCYLVGLTPKAVHVFRSDPGSDTSFTLREESIDLNKQEFSSVSPVRFVIPF